MYKLHKLSCRASTDMWFDVVEQYGDIGRFLSILSILGLVMYFITSSDSGSLVIDCLSANGNPDPPVLQRIFWALTEGATATALLKAGGKNALYALQTASVAAGLPYTFILNFMCVALWRAVRVDAGEIHEDDGKWHISVFSGCGTRRRAMKFVISLVAPWYYLADVASYKKDCKRSAKSFVGNSVLLGILFYGWIFLMIAEVRVTSISYIGWALLIAFFAYASGIRGSIRETQKLQGNMIEDFFCLMLVYPLAIVQVHEQMLYSEDPKIDSYNSNHAEL